MQVDAPLDTSPNRQLDAEAASSSPGAASAAQHPYASAPVSAPSGPQPGRAYLQHPTVFEVEKNARDAAGLPSHAPFASRGEWELTEIIIDSGLSQRYTDSLLRSKMVST